MQNNLQFYPRFSPDFAITKGELTKGNARSSQGRKQTYRNRWQERRKIGIGMALLKILGMFRGLNCEDGYQDEI
jgi:hypothetical protein